MVTIALIEDEVDLRDEIREELEYEGFKVETAGDGAEGLDLIKRIRPDMILSDINMPVMNGYQMRTKLVEEAPELSRTPFIFLSAYADQSDIADGLTVGADHYLTKPVDFDVMLGWVRKLT